MDTDARIDFYRQFLLEVREIGKFWHALPKEVVRWWNAREQSSVKVTRAGTQLVTGPVESRGRAVHVAVHSSKLQLCPERESESSNAAVR